MTESWDGMMGLCLPARTGEADSPAVYVSGMGEGGALGFFLGRERPERSEAE